MSRPDSREKVLAAVRRSLEVGVDDPERRLAVQKRLYDHRANIVPARTRLARQDLLEQFRAMLESQSAEVREVAVPDAVPEAIADCLREHNLGARIRMGEDPYLAAMDWDRASSLERVGGPSDGTDEVGLSHAFAGISETGTLLLVSGADNPTTLNFLPAMHIVVVRRSDVVGAYEDAWSRIRGAYGERTMPRTVNLVSGPSRTADIEQTLIMGAHGPVGLHVIVVGDADDEAK